MKVRAILGPDSGDDKEVTILGRVFRWHEDGIRFEADPRQIEKLLRDLDMVSCRLVAVPGIKPSGDGEAEEDEL